MDLFKNLGETKNNDELDIVCKKFKYDRSYICLATCVQKRKERQWIENLWRQCELYLDTNFWKDFQMQFIQRSWELYLAATLINRGFKLEKSIDWGPDFKLLGNRKVSVVWIEAMALMKGDGKNSVPGMIYDDVQNIPEEEMLLRISSGLEIKFEQYEHWVQKSVIKENEPYIIAINRCDLEYMDPEVPLIFKALFGIGHLALRIFSSDDKQEKPKPFWSERKEIKKFNGNAVSMEFFKKKRHNGVSGIIYCKDNILNSPWEPKEMGENFIFVHNPLAKNPLPNNFVPFGSIYKEKNNYICKIRNNKKWEKADPF